MQMCVWMRKMLIGRTRWLLDFRVSDHFYCVIVRKMPSLIDSTAFLYVIVIKGAYLCRVMLYALRYVQLLIHFYFSDIARQEVTSRSFSASSVSIITRLIIRRVKPARDGLLYLRRSNSSSNIIVMLFCLAGIVRARKMVACAFTKTSLFYYTLPVLC